MPSFEEAKKKWLEKIGNKSFAQLEDERDAENDAKAKKLMTPEYVENWGKIKEDAKGN